MDGVDDNIKMLGSGKQVGILERAGGTQPLANPDL